MVMKHSIFVFSTLFLPTIYQHNRYTGLKSSALFDWLSVTKLALGK
ncbi:hypothetical protein K6Y31_05245 [Motilimonas cestriensis]|uniref:Uncharacterized protein n=1 Tax=Motilimonas cestriensis TaxID=2742685 RepID=A0ABS8W5G3_9GAMM|nr:hypothetical protein [Motilimonas cestriensis]MCE2594217.1 hypothetical protein [Motilimonas cestriensis]